METITRAVQSVRQKARSMFSNRKSTATSTENIAPDTEVPFKTDWKSIFVVTIVGFVGEIQTATLIPLVWPYMQEINPSLSETLYGLLRGLWSLGVVVSAIVSGYVANRLGNFKPVIVFGQIMMILGCVSFMFIELFGKGQTAFLVVFELLFGVAVGAAGMYRAHIVMASSESDRSKAIGIATFAPALSYVASGVVQLAFSSLSYPGSRFIFGIHLNLYTAPILLILCFTLAATVLLFLMFDGTMRVPPAEIKLDDAGLDDKIIETGSNTSGSYDKIAVAVMLLTQMIFSLSALGITTISLIFAMAAFQWTSADSVLYTSLALGGAGVIFIAFVVAYAFCRLGNRLPPRQAMMVGVTCFLVFYLVSFPWPFISQKMVYKHPVGTPGSSHFNESVTWPNVSNNSLVGCNVDYKWCESTSVTNDFLYMVTLVVSVALAVPLININGPLLYSTILGPIKQGTLQGVYSASGDILNIIGPYLYSLIYQKSGPIYLWMALIILSVLCVVLWIVFYKRMIPYSESQAAKLKQRRRASAPDNNINSITDNL